MHRKRFGFTLIELLVVIAIIAILASVLLPAIARAREEGRKSNCKSNLRQVGITMEAYVDNYGDQRFLPFDADGGVESLSLLYSPPQQLLTGPGVVTCPSTVDNITTRTTLSTSTCS